MRFHLSAAVETLFLRSGILLPTAAVTLLAVVTSIATTWLCLFAFLPGGAPILAWLPSAVAVPALLVPVFCGLLLSMAHELARAKAALAEAAATDALTGVANRASFMERAETLLAVHGEDRAMTLLAIDVDHFKRVNDSFGHVVGDRVLRTIARRCASGLGRADLFARLGGEEFVALLVDTTPDDARFIAEAMRREVAALTFGADGPQDVTISIGIAGTQGSIGPTVEALMIAADRHLYAAKGAGRNRVAGALAA